MGTFFIKARYHRKYMGKIKGTFKTFPPKNPLTIKLGIFHKRLGCHNSIGVIGGIGDGLKGLQEVCPNARRPSTQGRVIIKPAYGTILPEKSTAVILGNRMEPLASARRIQKETPIATRPP